MAAARRILVDAQAILDLVQFQAGKSPRQCAWINRLARESEGTGSRQRTAVQINEGRCKAEMGTDPVRDIVDRERTNLADRANLPFDFTVKRFECLAATERRPRLLEFAVSHEQGSGWNAVLMRMTLERRQPMAKAGMVDGLFQCPQPLKLGKFGAGKRATLGNVIVGNIFKGHVSGSLRHRRIVAGDGARVAKFPPHALCAISGMEGLSMKALNIISMVCAIGLVVWTVFNMMDFAKNTSPPLPPVERQSRTI